MIVPTVLTAAVLSVIAPLLLLSETFPVPVNPPLMVKTLVVEALEMARLSARMSGTLMVSPKEVATWLICAPAALLFSVRVPPPLAARMKELDEVVMSPMLRIPRVREATAPSSVTVLFDVLILNVRLPVKPAPSAIVELAQFAELLQVPLLLTFQVPLAACEVDAAIASKSEEARRSLESSGEREGVQRVIFFMCWGL